MEVLLELFCSAMTLIYATNPYTIQLIPKGNCTHCCPINADDIKMYVNIYELGTEIEFDWENGTDWRLLDNNRTTVIYVHGFTEQASGPAAADVRQAYMSRGKENLLVVDWSPLAAGPWYHSAAFNTHKVSKWLAGVIDSLVISGLPLSSIHLIGFSLGAEIAGQTAKQITVGKLRRVTGLDPALPLFHELDPKNRLTDSDADFVDVIHTDGGIFGFETPMGHADFFPNGGKPAQPGCKIENLIHTGRLNELVACSHNRAWKFYAESVRNPYAFPAYKCDSITHLEKGKCSTNEVAYMGYLVDPNLRGKFFLDTKDTKPYGLGQHEDTVYGINHLRTHEGSEHMTPNSYGDDRSWSTNLENNGYNGGSDGFQDVLYDMNDKLPLERGVREVLFTAMTQYRPANYEEELQDISTMYNFLMPNISDTMDLQLYLLPEIPMLTYGSPDNTNLEAWTALENGDKTASQNDIIERKRRRVVHKHPVFEKAELRQIRHLALDKIKHKMQTELTGKSLR